MTNSHTEFGWISSNGLGGDSLTDGRRRLQYPDAFLKMCGDNHPVYHKSWKKLCHLLSSSPKTELQHLNNLPYLTEVQMDISDLPFVQNK